VDSFTSNQLSLGHLRYLHIQNFPQLDEFKFTASLGPVTTPTYDFRITFTQLKIGIQRQVNPQINGQVEFTLTNAFLFHQTTPIPTFSRHIIYTVVTAPKFGYIYVDGYPEYALPGDSFTQQDIDKNLMRFKTYAACYSSFIDTLEFSVSVPECEDVKGKLDFIFNPLESLSKQLTYQKREKIFVKEGGRSVLSRLNFDVLFNKFNFLSFNLTHFPKRGSLCLLHDQEGKVEHINSFTLDSLYLGDVYYCHDDSESTEDAFRILVVSDNETDFQYMSEVFVEIELENDNGPYRVFDNPFHIVREESKMLTGQDLKYADPDIDTSVNDIMYTHVSPANGEVIKAGVNVNIFSQDDLDQRIVLFKHNGPDSGQLSFIVTDGVFEVPGHLDVMASDPFLKVRETNASIVQEGRMVLITKEDLSVDTNLNAKPEDVEYKIVADPSYGVLKLFKRKFNETFISRANNATSALNFTQADVEKERLVYWNTDVASMDKIK
jgi:chondroitin sulfate proteoglycan 4